MLLVGCGGDGTQPDMATEDLAGADLAGADLSGAGGDLAAYPDPIAGTGSVTEVTPGPTYQFLEGPLWRAADNFLLFSDVPANIIYKYTPGSGVVSFRGSSGGANGNAADQNGLLITCIKSWERLWVKARRNCSASPPVKLAQTIAMRSNCSWNSGTPKVRFKIGSKEGWG